MYHLKKIQKISSTGYERIPTYDHAELTCQLLNFIGLHITQLDSCENNNELNTYMGDVDTAHR